MGIYKADKQAQGAGGSSWAAGRACLPCSGCFFHLRLRARLGPGGGTSGSEGGGMERTEWGCRISTQARPPTRLAMFLRLLRVARLQQLLDPLPPQGAKGGDTCTAAWLGQGAAQAWRMGRGGGAGFPAPEQRKGETAPCQLHRSQQGAASAAPAFFEGLSRTLWRASRVPFSPPKPQLHGYGAHGKTAPDASGRASAELATASANCSLLAKPFPSWGGGRKPPQASCVAPGQVGGCWQRAKRGGGFRRLFASKILLVPSAPS